MKTARHDIYNAVIRRMVQEALTEKHEAFAQIHEQDTDAQLLSYIRSCAKDLGHSPHQMEVIGWPLLLARFGTWHDVLHRAGLGLPQTPNASSSFRIIQEEVAVQKRIYRKKKEQKRHQAEQRLVRQEQKRKEYCLTSGKKKNTK